MSRIRQLLTIVGVFLVSVSLQAQSPWDTTATRLATSFEGPLARALGVIAIIVGGLVWMFGGSGAQRLIVGILGGGVLVFGASRWIGWF